MTTTDVLLISMPFAPLYTPSLGLSLLKAALTRDGVTARIRYFSLAYAESIGELLYTHLSQETLPQDLIGDWIFADCLFAPQPASQVQRFVDEIMRGRLPEAARTNDDARHPSEEQITQILAARNKAAAFLDRCVEEVLACQPRIVGFTSVFQQQVASLALAKRLKTVAPEIFILFGGANCEGVIGEETMRQFPFVDALVSGEADSVFPELVRRIFHHQLLKGLPGVITPARSPLPIFSQAVTPTAMVDDVDALPIPDYDDYFEQLNAGSLRLALSPQVLLETSRGCWWGEKHHCTFCGLNGETMKHRSKSAQRALDELFLLVEKYPGLPVRVVDNILDMRYFKDFLPRLAERQAGVQLFYEVKANLKKEQLQQLKAAGISTIQPGIESLSTKVLQIMRKGVKGLQNIQLLKWCAELGLVPDWNFLWGFPGEPRDEYDRMGKLLPLLSHLQPPYVGLNIRLDRFSPNFDEAEELGFVNLAPYPAYGYIYPFAPQVVANLAYYFTFDYATPQDVASYAAPLQVAICQWQRDYATSQLFYMERDERLLILDSRPIALTPLLILTGLSKLIYQLCDRIRTPQQLLDECRKQGLMEVDLPAIMIILTDLQEKMVLLEEEGAYLTLAVRGNA